MKTAPDPPDDPRFPGDSSRVESIEAPGLPDDPGLPDESAEAPPAPSPSPQPAEAPPPPPVAGPSGPRSDGKILLLLPGLGCDEKMWRHQIAGFAERGWSVHVADIKRDPTLPGMAERAVRQIDATHGPGAKFCLGAFSMGGYAGLWILLHQPERIVRACVLSSATRKPTEDAPSATHPSFQLLDSGMPEDEITAKFLKAARKKLPAYTHHPNEELDKLLLGSLGDTGAQGLKNQYLAMTDPPDLAPRLGEIETPVLLIWSRDDQLVPPRRSRELERGLPNVRTKILTEASHFVTLEKPEEVTAAMLGFLDVPAPSRAEKNNRAEEAL